MEGETYVDSALGEWQVLSPSRQGWSLTICSGISHGPVYVGYPSLKDLGTRGMRNVVIAVFLYNRVDKAPLLPMMIYYFGVLFVVVLTATMVIASLAQLYCRVDRHIILA